MQKIPLTQGQYALVDDSDYDYLMQWKWKFADRKKYKSVYRYASSNKYKKKPLILIDVVASDNGNYFKKRLRKSAINIGGFKSIIEVENAKKKYEDLFV